MAKQVILRLAIVEYDEVPKEEDVQAEVRIVIFPGSKEADLLDALQRGVCSAYEALKRANSG